MTSLDYLAGVLDVNGSLIVTRLRDSDGPRVLILVQNKNRALPDLFAAAFGGKVMCSKLPAGQRWHWSKQGLAAQAVLRTLYPLMHVRLREVERLLAITIRPRGGQRRQVSIGAELGRVAG